MIGLVVLLTLGAGVLGWLYARLRRKYTTALDMLLDQTTRVGDLELANDETHGRSVDTEKERDEAHELIESLIGTNLLLADEATRSMPAAPRPGEPLSPYAEPTDWCALVAEFETEGTHV